MDVRKKGGVLSSVRGELDRFTRASGVDDTLLGRWTWIELCSHKIKIMFVIDYNYADSSS